MSLDARTSAKNSSSPSKEDQPARLYLVSIGPGKSIRSS